MNLQSIVNSVITAINPNFPATLFISTGNTVVNFKPIPSYAQAAVSAQVQPLSSGDIRQLDSLNIQGAQKAIWINGPALGVIRIKNLGGDLIIFADGTLPEGNVWLLLASLEQWADWCKVAVILQDESAAPTPSNSLITDLSDPNNQVVVPAVLTGV